MLESSNNHKKNQAIMSSEILFRVCEPEVMDDVEEAMAYGGIDNEKPNRAFVAAVCENIGHRKGLILDIGCGPGDIAFMLAEQFPASSVLGVDLSPAMLEMARLRAKQHNPQITNVDFVLADGKSSQLVFESAHLIVSNSVVHHVHDPLQLFKEIARLVHPQGGIFIRDLNRPQCQADLEDLVHRYTVNDTPLQRKLFADSLHAALSKDEVEAFVTAAGLTGCTVDLVGELYWQVTRRAEDPISVISRIRREDVPSITSITTAGLTHDLGIHKDFRRHPLLKEFMPEDGRFSVSWVHLEPEQTLVAHSHPVASMIIVCSGAGRAFGANEVNFADGDILFIPPQVKHGFQGKGTHGYWALSVQFDGAGLYENIQNPRVGFVGDQITRPQAKIIALNEGFMERHLGNKIFALIASEQIADPKCRDRMFDAIQIWSNIFQTLVHLRCAVAQGRHLATAIEHFQEEYRHNEMLAEDRAETLKSLWDAKLVSYCTWFQWKMLTESDSARSAIVHLVLEGGALLFHGRAQNALGKFRETTHFETHSHADDEHFQMGIQMLDGLGTQELEHLEKLLPEAWDMLDLVCERIAELALQLQGTNQAGV